MNLANIFSWDRNNTHLLLEVIEDRFVLFAFQCRTLESANFKQRWYSVLTNWERLADNRNNLCAIYLDRISYSSSDLYNAHTRASIMMYTLPEFLSEKGNFAHGNLNLFGVVSIPDNCSSGLTSNTRNTRQRSFTPFSFT